MKKFLMAICALAVATTVATAGVGILWSTQFGVYDSSISPPLNGGSGALLDSYSAIWQLIYAGADNMIDDISTTAPVAGGPNGDYVIGDDVVWGQREIALGGGGANDAPYNTTWDNWMVNQSGFVSYEDLGWSTAGFVYQRIFEGTPANQTWYFESPLQALNTGYAGGGQPPELFYVDTSSEGVKPTMQIDVVPEPATMGLLGLGALVMAIRRRRS